MTEQRGCSFLCNEPTLNRIKEHGGTFKSGLLKKLAVSFGKRNRAIEIHKYDVSEATDIVGKILLEKMSIIAGLGIIENHFRDIVFAIRLLCQPE